MSTSRCVECVHATVHIHAPPCSNLARAFILSVSEDKFMITHAIMVVVLVYWHRD
jgi:hypothetical protein